MDDPATSTLQYGHLGKATYVPETQSWNFSRSLAPPFRVSYEGVSRLAVESPLCITSYPSPSDRKSAVTRSFPELAPAWTLLRHERLSRMISATADMCDPHLSSLLDLGHAVDFHGKGRVVPIAAFASGECGNAITFRKLDEETIKLRQRGSEKVRVPCIGTSESTEWVGFQTPVLQISFARTIQEKSTWMAARFARSTVIFRPQYHRTPVPMDGSLAGDPFLFHQLHNSRLNANMIVDIPTSRTGGFPHANVTFNPWYQKQVGLVDNMGNWSIWEISGRQGKKDERTITFCHSGSLQWLDIGGSPYLEPKPRHDGWAVIEWAGDVSTFIVADRRCAVLYRIDGSRILSHAIEWQWQRKSEWVLDIQRASYNPSLVFILTTSRVLFLDVRSVSSSTTQPKAESSLHPKLIWRHFRDPEDTTLRLTSLSVEQRFYLILHSRLSNFVQALQCHDQLDEDFGMTAVHDPFALTIPRQLSVSSGAVRGRQECFFSTLIFRDLGHSSTVAVRKHSELNLNLIKLFAITSDLAVRETLYTSPVGESDGAATRDVLRARYLHPSVKRNEKAVTDEFIVHDWDESNVNYVVLTLPASARNSRSGLDAESAHWTVDYGPVYSVAIGRVKVPSSNISSGQTAGINFDQALAQISERVNETSHGVVGVSNTLLEVIGDNAVLDDIYHNSQDFERVVLPLLSSQPRRHFGLEALPLSLLGFLRPNVSTKMSSLTSWRLVDIYDQLVNDWLSVLPHNIPGRTRIMKEKIIRGMTVDLALSSLKVVRNRQGTAISEEVGTASNGREVLQPDNVDRILFSGWMDPRPTDSSLTLPVRSRPVGLEPNSAAIRTPGSIDPNAGHESTFNTLASLTAPGFHRSVSRTASNLLSHWTVGSDPATYDWKNMEQEMKESDLQPEDPTQTPNRRVRKIVSQGSVADSSSVPGSTPAVPVVRTWGSQPDNLPSRTQLQSSQAVEDELPMTQIEQGTFGGRETSKTNAIKARKKKRAAGF